jgi:hypothetical protein
MELAADKMAELRVMHLEMLQAIVARMAGYGMSFKRLCITVTTAVCGFGITLHRPLVILFALFPVIAFAILDTQCLRVERRFRQLYDPLRCEPWNVTPDFAIDLSNVPQIAGRDVIRSWSIAGFYIPLIISVVTIAGIGRYVHASL